MVCPALGLRARSEARAAGLTAALQAPPCVCCRTVPLRRSRKQIAPPGVFHEWLLAGRKTRRREEFLPDNKKVERMMNGSHLFSTTAVVLALAFSSAAVARDDLSAGQGQKDQQQSAQTMQRQYDQQEQQQTRDRQQRQRNAQQQRSEPTPVILMRDWNYDTIYGRGWSAERLMDDASVYGPTGEDIGSIENIVIDQKGRIAGLVAEIGGFLDIGDTHVFVPWNQVQVSPDRERVTIPVTEETVEDYSTWADDYLRKAESGRRQVVQSDLGTGPRLWKATDLIGDYAFLDASTSYGNVSDLIFTDDGSLHAVVVNASAGWGGGNFALPYYGYPYGWGPGYPAYYTGYSRDDVVNLQELDYRKLNRNMAGQNQEDGVATTGAAKDTQSDTPSKKNRSERNRSR